MGNKKKTPISHRPKSKLVGYCGMAPTPKTSRETNAAIKLIVFFCGVES
jgi:hypothetical protein